MNTHFRLMLLLMVCSGCVCVMWESEHNYVFRSVPPYMIAVTSHDKLVIMGLDGKNRTEFSFGYIHAISFDMAYRQLMYSNDSGLYVLNLASFETTLSERRGPALITAIGRRAPGVAYVGSDYIGILTFYPRPARWRNVLTRGPHKHRSYYSHMVYNIYGHVKGAVYLGNSDNKVTKLLYTMKRDCVNVDMSCHWKTVVMLVYCEQWSWLEIRDLDGNLKRKIDHAGQNVAFIYVH